MEGKLRDWGGEYGATTGRPRGCGWLDLVALKHAVLLSGVTEIAITKLDILSHCESIKVATHYELDGVSKNTMPFETEGDKIVPIYTEFTGWKASLRGAQNEKELPQGVLDYLSFIEKAVGVPISIISTGPDRNEAINRNV